MSQVKLKWSEAALRDIVRLHSFLTPKSPAAAMRAIAAIRTGVKVLAKHPEIGRPVEEMPPEFREWIIEFGQSAYVVLYHFDGREVVLVAVRHGREAGY
jgi:plasmid stabilization system protein ParE